ncbi:unnamed protein product [Spirodela intermedia]|uniref:DUF4408 domain-containing protein n=2 Tax=Spirodela intermedia TaxID=51605 RepID=A0A7I8KEU7_SPIIN|nr:unnamed protein product [Spirodela intermedia]
MDAVKIEKLQAMRRHSKNRFLINLCQYLLFLLCFGLFLSSPLWLPKVIVFLWRFFFLHLPTMGERLLCPKCLFLLGNLIVVFLVGDSKLSGRPPRPGLYEEYVDRSEALRRPASISDTLKGEEPSEPYMEEQEGREYRWGEEEEEEPEEEEEEEEEEEKNALPAEELNKRVEDFIARVNSQRSLEARLIARRA